MDARARSLRPREEEDDDDDDDDGGARVRCARPSVDDERKKVRSKATTNRSIRDETPTALPRVRSDRRRSIGRRGEIEPGGRVGLDFSPTNLSRAVSIISRLMTLKPTTADRARRERRVDEMRLDEISLLVSPARATSPPHDVRMGRGQRVLHGQRPRGRRRRAGRRRRRRRARSHPPGRRGGSLQTFFETSGASPRRTTRTGG